MIFKTNKKGMFFTILAIVMLSLFLLTYSFSKGMQNSRSSLDKRIKTMDNFVFSLEKDISRQMYISGFRAMLSVNNVITSNGTFVASAEDSLEEALANGTVNGISQPLMVGYKLQDWDSRNKALGSMLNLNINYTVAGVRVSQDDSWNVKINASVHLVVIDKGGLASWDKQEGITTKIPIVGFEDPFYILNTNGLVANKIVVSPYQTFVIGNDVSNLLDHAQSSYYIASSTAPSFLDRLEGKNSANVNGIESLVNLEKLSSQGLIPLNKTAVDYIYFSDANPSSCNVIPAGMPSWFKLDYEHLATYQVNCA